MLGLMERVKVRLTLKTTRVFYVFVLDGFSGEGVLVILMDYTVIGVG